MIKNFKIGFTLAEVLLTLGIIGIVAAMTIPSLINKYNAKQYRVKLKKAVSVIYSADRMADSKYSFGFKDIGYDIYKKLGVTNGRIEYFELGGLSDNPENTLTLSSLINGTLSNATYVGNLKSYYSNNDNGYSGEYQQTGTTVGIEKFVSGGGRINLNDYVGWITPDGILYGFAIKSGYHEAPIIIDVNGKQGPNNLANCGDPFFGRTGGCLNFDKNEPFDTFIFLMGSKDLLIPLKGTNSALLTD